MSDLTKFFYDIYYKYEGAKEYLFWIAFTLYFGFSGVVIKWMLDNQDIIKILDCPLRVKVTILLSLVGGLALLFVCIQNLYKARSAQTSDELLALLTTDRGRNPESAKELKRLHNAIAHFDRDFEESNRSTNKHRRSTLCLFWEKGRSGVVILAIMAVFLTAQLCLLWSHKT